MIFFGSFGFKKSSIIQVNYYEKENKLMFVIKFFIFRHFTANILCWKHIIYNITWRQMSPNIACYEYKTQNMLHHLVVKYMVHQKLKWQGISKAWKVSLVIFQCKNKGYVFIYICPYTHRGLFCLLNYYCFRLLPFFLSPHSSLFIL